jgi:stress-induced morphogen
MPNEMRKKIEKYSYGLNDHLDLNVQSNIFKGVNEETQDRVVITVVDLRNR